MPKVQKLNGAMGDLGSVVELHELTVGQWLEMQEEMLALNDQERSFRMLARMVQVDGAPLGWDRLQTLGISDVQQALECLNEIMGGEEGNA
jgi:hypothetical protein